MYIYIYLYQSPSKASHRRGVAHEEEGRGADDLGEDQKLGPAPQQARVGGGAVFGVCWWVCGLCLGVGVFVWLVVFPKEGCCFVCGFVGLWVCGCVSCVYLVFFFSRGVGVGGRIGAFDSSSSYTRTHTPMKTDDDDDKTRPHTPNTQHLCLALLGVPGFREARAVVAVHRPL